MTLSSGVLFYYNFINNTAYIETSPSSQTARAGRWMNFTCGIQCSQRDLIAWFLNGSTLSLFQDTRLNFQQYPGHSQCSTSQRISKENHILSLMATRDLYFPLEVYCVVISGCGEGSWHQDQCISYTCSSETVYFGLRSKF